jgi:hypothetical protein
MSWFPQTCPLFQASALCMGVHFNCLKYPGHWPLSIVKLNFAVVIIYVIVCSSHWPHFNCRTYFHSLPMDMNACSQSLVTVIQLSGVASSGGNKHLCMYLVIDTV